SGTVMELSLRRRSSVQGRGSVGESLATGRAELSAVGIARFEGRVRTLRHVVVLEQPGRAAEVAEVAARIAPRVPEDAANVPGLAAQEQQAPGRRHHAGLPSRVPTTT